jgi:hypothetical protein
MSAGAFHASILQCGAISRLTLGDGKHLVVEFDRERLWNRAPDKGGKPRRRIALPSIGNHNAQRFLAIDGPSQRLASHSPALHEEFTRREKRVVMAL